MVTQTMKSLGFDEITVNKALRGELVCSTPTGLEELRTEVKKKLAELQQQFGDSCQFYHILEYGIATIYGDMHMVDFLMYCPDEWQAYGTETMMMTLGDGEVRAYSWNVNDDDFSEVGNIGVKMQDNGALIRVW